MKGKHFGIDWKWTARSAAILGLFLFTSSHPPSEGKNLNLPSPDPCEQAALQAYWKALKFCQLAEPDNPRLRCYEAAKAVYRKTLEDCHCRAEFADPGASSP